jgi:hypothetical protein
MDASVATKPNISSISRTSAAATTIASAIANPFAFTSKVIAGLISQIQSLKNHPDQTPQVRPLNSYTSLSKAGAETIIYDNPLPVAVPGQQREVAQVKTEPGIKTAPAKNLVGQLKIACQLITDPELRDLFIKAINEQQKLTGAC